MIKYKLMKQIVKDHAFYQAPQIIEVVINTEGLLCGSFSGGQTDDLQKEDLGDIWC